ncbi:MAG: sporulation protein YabP [Desulfotomaculaceae bacterium]|nr:sporulation protein YabP [Desulfotomaculaceae bacterium]
MNEQANHNLSMRSRKQLTLEGVRHVGSFNDNEITLETSMGFLILKGEGLHITQLSLDTGTIEVEGFFTALSYMESKGKGKGKGLLGRILK